LFNLLNPSSYSAFLASLAVVSGCTGAIGGGLQPGGNGLGGNGGAVGGGGGVSNLPAPAVSLPSEQACTTHSAGPTMLRRLSADQLVASMIDLFGDPAVPVAPVFNDPLVLGFGVDSNALVVQGLNADQLMTNAETVATWAVSNHLAQVTGCASADPGCPDSFIRSFGKRAFREPLSDDSVATYKALFAGESAFDDGVTLVIAAMLQSPRFLYRAELGPAGGAAPAAGAPIDLTPYEVASSLSYLLTGSAPDATLLSAADSVAGGSLALRDMLDQQTDRLIADPRSQQALMSFMNGWLGLDRLYSAVKDDAVLVLSSSLRDAMAQETRSLILDTFGSNGSFSDMLTADHSFLNADLAAYYGFDTNGLSSAAFTRVAYLGGHARDGGILAHAGILTGYARADVSSPTQRGHLVRTRLLCQYVQPPPAVLDTTFKPEANPTTTRAHYENSHAVGGCGDCHKLMDKIGFGFEHYDAFGRWRDSEGVYPIDATGTIVQANATDGDVAFDGLPALETYLAGSDDLKSCMVRYWSYFAYGSPSWSEDACTYSAIRDEAAPAGYGLRSTLTAIVHAPHFTRRVQAQ
jgi:Protein of unknown function (DUF1592)/Protein of unknown function (DUF1588)/Protein of unknown function (DUF1595)/Protein of unknown function (DUF1585)/Protein of unknown function (DUF1587)